MPEPSKKHAEDLRQLESGEVSTVRRILNIIIGRKQHTKSDRVANICPVVTVTVCDEPTFCRKHEEERDILTIDRMKVA